MKKLNGIKVIIWDFDNTLYHKIPDLQRDFENALIAVLTHHRSEPPEELKRELERLHPAKFASDTMTVAYMCHIPVAQAAGELETYFNRLKYLKYDRKLVDLFKQISKFSHFILTNGIISKTREGIERLGLNPDQFQEIISSEITGVNKPEADGFRFIMNLTKLPPAAHLMVGDRDAVDIAPAKALGLKTCLVWDESRMADASLPTVYDVALLFK